MAEERKIDLSNWTDTEIHEERDAVFGHMKDLQKRADERESDQKGVFTGDEEARWEALNTRYDDLGSELSKRDEVRAAQVQAEVRRQQLEELDERRGESRGRRADPDPVAGFEDQDRRSADIQDRVIRRWLESRGNGINLSPSEKRAMQADQDNIGGTLVASTQFVNRLVKFTDDLVFMRGLATILPLTNADSIEVPSWDTDPDDADNTSETGTGSEDSAARTGRRLLTPRPMGKRIKVSRKLSRISATPIVDFIAQRLAYKFSITEEKDYLTGSGAGESLGVFTASNNGISTSRDVSTGNTTTSIKADGLIEAKFSLKAQYMNSTSLRWIFHRDAVKQIRKLKDGNGDYLWTRGLAGTPDTILEVPYVMSEYAPSTFTTGLYVGILGDFSHYWIAEALGLEIQRLDELYAETNEIGLIGRKEVDAMPVLEEAFARVTLA